MFEHFSVRQNINNFGNRIKKNSITYFVRHSLTYATATFAQHFIERRREGPSKDHDSYFSIMSMMEKTKTPAPHCKCRGCKDSV